MEPLLLKRSKGVHMKMKLKATIPGIGLCIIGFAGCAWFASGIFSNAYISYQCIMLAAVFAMAQESSKRNIAELFKNKFEEAQYVD